MSRHWLVKVRTRKINSLKS